MVYTNYYISRDALIENREDIETVRQSFENFPVLMTDPN